VTAVDAAWLQVAMELEQDEAEIPCPPLVLQADLPEYSAAAVVPEGGLDAPAWPAPADRTAIFPAVAGTC
jgi:hypothetical protein